MFAALLIGALCLGAQEPFTTGPIETVSEGYQFTEGPLWLPDDARLIFSDIPADTIYYEDGEVFRQPSGQSNGLTLDRDARLVAAEHQNRRVSRTEFGGNVVVVAESFEGKRLNSPNDVVVRSDGMIFFTDPPYGLEGGLGGPNADLDFSGVYAVVGRNELRLIAQDFDRPNGLAMSPDERIMYIADTAENHIRVFDLADDGRLNNGRVFCELPQPDGIKVDVEGNVWSTARDGVRIFDESGELLETIEFPQQPANLAFGGEDGKTLFVTARSAVYQVPVRVEGIHPRYRRPVPRP